MLSDLSWGLLLCPAFGDVIETSNEEKTSMALIEAF